MERHGQWVALTPEEGEAADAPLWISVEGLRQSLLPRALEHRRRISDLEMYLAVHQDSVTHAELGAVRAAIDLLIQQNLALRRIDMELLSTP